MGDTVSHMITVIIPCFNEEENIEACLRSVVWADEILVVDSFSTDGTLDIVRRYTDRIVQHEYINSAAQKNWIIPQARHEWVLVVDCDERVQEGLRDEILVLLRNNPVKDGYWIRRKNFLFGKEVKHAGWGTDSVLRLFRRDVGRYQKKRVHAEVELDRTGSLQGYLEHYTMPSLHEWMQKIDRYTTWKAQDKYEGGMVLPVVHMIMRPFISFFRDYILRLGILDGWRGFLISSMNAFAELVMAAKVVQIVHESRLRANQ